jgi:hypothetical protein
MPKVPGNPMDDGGIPAHLQPSMGDLYVAAGLLMQRNDPTFRVAGDLLQGPWDKNAAALNRMPNATPKARTQQILGRALGTDNVLPMTPPTPGEDNK